jgi:hypothetical protein
VNEDASRMQDTGRLTENSLVPGHVCTITAITAGTELPLMGSRSASAHAMERRPRGCRNIPADRSTPIGERDRRGPVSEDPLRKPADTFLIQLDLYRLLQSLPALFSLGCQPRRREKRARTSLERPQVKQLAALRSGQLRNQPADEVSGAARLQPQHAGTGKCGNEPFS